MKQISVFVLFYLILLKGHSKNKLVNGEILAADNLPIIGATIIEDGTKNQMRGLM